MKQKEGYIQIKVETKAIENRKKKRIEKKRNQKLVLCKDQ